MYCYKLVCQIVRIPIIYYLTNYNFPHIVITKRALPRYDLSCSIKQSIISELVVLYVKPASQPRSTRIQNKMNEQLRYL